MKYLGKYFLQRYSSYGWKKNEVKCDTIVIMFKDALKINTKQFSEGRIPQAFPGGPNVQI